MRASTAVGPKVAKAPRDASCSDRARAGLGRQPVDLAADVGGFGGGIGERDGAVEGFAGLAVAPELQ